MFHLSHWVGDYKLLVSPLTPGLYLGYIIASSDIQLVRRAGDMEEETL